jgi:hypothetical protein
MLKSEGGLNAVNDAYKPLLDKYITNRIANAFYHSYQLTPAEASELQGYFPHQLVLQKDGARRESQHPVLAVLNDYANREVSRAIRDLPRGAIAMTFGDSADCKLKAHHNCLLYGEGMSARDNTRVAQTPGASDSQRNNALHSFPTPDCHHGFGRCRFRADVLYSVNAAYDVSMDEFARGFFSHGLKTAVIYMLIAPELIDSSYAGVFDCFRTQTDGNSIIFHMRDYSAPYCHSIKKWRDWMTVSLIDCGANMITLERVRTNGPLMCITATMVTRSLRNYYTTIPVTNWFPDHSLVPDIAEWVEKGSIHHQKDLRHYVVPNNVVLALMAYAQRTADDAYKFNEIASYASGLRRSIIIGGKTYQEKWLCGPAEYSRVLVSLFILGAIARTDRTQTIKHAFGYLKNHFHGQPWYNPILRFIDRICPTSGRPAGDHLPNFYVKNITDFVVSEVYHFGSIADRIKDGIDRLCRACRLPEPCRCVSTSAFYQTSDDVEIEDTPDVEVITTSSEPIDIKPGKLELNINTDPGDYGTCTCSLNDHEARAFPALVDDIVMRSFKLIPDHFRAGHCAFQAFHQAMGTHLIGITPRQIFQSYLIGVLDTFTPESLACYIHHGDYMQYCSGAVIGTLAAHYGMSVQLHELRKPTLIINAGATNGPIHIYHNGVHGEGGHYSAFPSGGSARSSKFERIIADNRVAGKVLDVSAAPGDFSSICVQRPNIELTSCFYKPGVPMRTSDMFPVVPYRSPEDLAAKIDCVYDFIFNDAARPVGSELIIAPLNLALHGRLAEGGCLITKSFGNGHDVFRLYASHFDNIDERIYSENGTERYFTLRGYTKKARFDADERFYTAYETYNRDVTVHVLPTPEDLKTFTDEYFSGEMSKHKPKFVVAPPMGPKANFIVEAVTGVASASKTTTAIKNYGTKAIFIAPSRTLCLAHQRAGVRSFTPHVLFTSVTPEAVAMQATTFVIDEISQFPVHYIALVHARYPTSKIVILGDVMQTPYINYGSSTKYKTVVHYGITNNMLVAYKIPQDVARAINRQHKLGIVSMSPIENGICFYRDVIDKFANTKIPVICFNDTTAKMLRDKNISAQTITCYTGSRDHTVVFYVDSASIASQIINRSEWMYTAMSRATHQLVIAGDFNPIASYYAIHGSPIREFETISQAYIQNDHKTHTEQTISLASTTEVASISATPACAEAILQEHIKPCNDPDNEFLLTSNPELPELQSGFLHTQMDTAANPDASVKVYKIALSKFVKNQVSSNTEQTLATLIKRYSRKYKVKMTTKVRAATGVDLRNGLMRALYNRTDVNSRFEKDMRIAPEELRDYTCQYFEKLQKKMNANPAAAQEFDTKWEEVEEVLSFFNKRQSKFDPKEGFDTSDKVGQGVAANSKAVNIIFGGYARAMIERVRYIAQKNGRNIILATHDSEAQVNDMYMHYLAQHKGEPTWACNDFSEWDASFRTPFADLTAWLLRLMGAPQELVDWFSNFRMRWTMVYRNKFGTTKLVGTEKQFSGNPFTIVENTIGNLALCFAIFNYSGYSMALFKGDDSAVLCRSSVLTTRGKEIIGVTGHGLKLHIGPVGEFAGWFLTPEGIFPDVVRYSAKFLDKNYRDRDHFLEALSSLQERLTAVKTQSQVQYGLCMTQCYYRSIGLHFTPGELENLYAFIKNSRSVRFEHLVACDLPNLNVN